MKNKEFCLNVAYWLLVFSGILMGAYLFMQGFFGDQSKSYYYLSALAILISAFLASVSMMKSIQNTRILDEEKKNQELQRYHIVLKKVLIDADLIRAVLSQELSEVTKNKIDHWRELIDQLKNHLNDNHIVEFMNKEQFDTYINLRINTYYLDDFFKKVSKIINIDVLDLSKENNILIPLGNFGHYIALLSKSMKYDIEIGKEKK